MIALRFFMVLTGRMISGCLMLSQGYRCCEGGFSRCPAVEEQIKKINAERNLIIGQIETLVGDINKINNTLEGKSNSVFESVGKSLTSVTSGLANFRDKLKEYVADMALAIPNIVNIMTLFVFRTVILPLVFLYAFMKAFKLIWGVNVRKAIESGYSDLKKEVAGG